MKECVKCGQRSPDAAEACPRCTWPFSLSAWTQTTYSIRRVTVDTNCINAKQGDDLLNTIERWAAHGLLVIQRSNVLLPELKGPQRIAKATAMQAHPEPWVLGLSKLGIDTTLAGPDMANSLRHVLFPTTKQLLVNQESDVQHLRLHVLTGGDAFLTSNTRDFIARGKQSTLWRLGVWAFTPAGLVALLKQLYDWS